MPESLERSAFLRRIDGKRFQVLVIGGGITGAGIAWDCALRGLSVALLERTDFAAGTSSVSSKMVHAGLRYMANDPQFVREASAERRLLFLSCPHLARPLEYYLPVYENSPEEYGAAALPAILRRYDELAAQINTAPGRLVDPAQALAEIPGLRPAPSLVGSYWDGVMDDARFTLEVVRSAAQEGAAVLNHAQVTGFLKNASGRVVGVSFRDEDPAAAGADHEVTAEAVVLAGGVYTDLLLGSAAPEQPSALRPSKGMHLVFRSDLTAGRALVVPVGGNVLYFLVPFRPGYLVMGCTDTDYPVGSYEELDHVATTEAEVDFTLGILARVLPGVFARAQVKACYAGVRPLLRPPPVPGSTLSTSDTSRTHRIWRTPGGLWVIAGGKFTTFRLMAEQLTDGVVAELHERGLLRSAPPCSTAGHLCHGAPKLKGRPGGFEGWLSEASAELHHSTGLPEDCARHLCSAYGTSAAEVGALIAREPALGERIGEGRPFVLAEVRYAADQEMCRSAADFLARRSQLRFLEHQGLDVLDRVVEELAGCLGWGAEVRRRQAAEYREHIRRVSPI